MKIFLDREILETVIVFSGDYPNLFKIFTDKSEFVLDIGDDELTSLLSNSEDITTQILVGYDLPHFSSKGIISKFKNDYRSMLNEPRSLFFLNVSQREAEKIRADYGVLVVSSFDIDDGIFDNGYFRYRIDEDFQCQGGIQDNWMRVLRGLKMLPSNSLVVSDAYMFNTAHTTIDDCVKNVQGVLDAILPLEFEDTYHLLFFTGEVSVDNNLINKAIGDIKAFVRAKRGYDVIIEYVFYKSLHQRKIISNYNVVVFDKGIVTFRSCGKNVGLVGTNVILGSTVHENASNSVGHSVYDIATKDLKDLASWHQECKKICNSGIEDKNKRILGTNNKDRTLNNRILRTVIR